MTFIKVRNDFQYKLKQNIELIRSLKNVLVFADKSTNLYELSNESYEKLLHDNTRQTYKKHLWTQNGRSIENRRNSLKALALKTIWNAIQVTMRILLQKPKKKILEIISIVGWSMPQKVKLVLWVNVFWIIS